MSKKSKRRLSKSETSKPQIWQHIQQAVDEAYQLIEDGKPEEAIELLEPLAVRHARDPEVFYQLGYAYYQTGDLWRAVNWIQKSLDLRNDPELWSQIGYFYSLLNLKILALHALRQAVRQNDPSFPAAQAQQVIAEIEMEFQAITSMMNLPIEAAEKGFRYMEEGQVALQNGDYPRCISLNRSSIKFLGMFPPPRNNLSMALFFNGQWKEAVQTAQQVIGFDPQNIQALANLVRFLAWTGQEAEARVYWEMLKQIPPPNDDLKLKISEAAAVIEDDEAVYQLLKDMDNDLLASQGLGSIARLRLAIAEANLGMPSARKKLNQLKETSILAESILKAVKSGQRGLGWAERFPYFTESEYLPAEEFNRLLDLLSRDAEAPSKRSRKEIEQFTARFPQIVLVAKKTLLEHQQAEAGIQLLIRIGTPAAYAVLREFGLSQVGSDEARTKALLELMNAEQIQQDEMVRIWQKGEWRDVQLKRYEIKEGDNERPYSQRVADLINQGQEAFQKGNHAQAEKLFSRATELEPKAKEAYNNLGTIYADRGDEEGAKAMFQRAIDVDPYYVLARCNLATFFLDDENVEQAKAIIAPLAELPQFTPQMIAFLSYIRARIAVIEDNFDEARNNLEIAIQMNPDYELAKDLLTRINLSLKIKHGFAGMFESQRKRDRATRARMQELLSTTNPSLEDTFGMYSKDAMTGMGRVLAPSGGWSTFKKARLTQFLIERLQDFDILSWVVNNLQEDERRALYTVLDQGGYMLWQAFADTFGDDLEESRHWQYHQPETVMGRLRIHGLLVETTVKGERYLAIPVELREPLKRMQK